MIPSDAELLAALGAHQRGAEDVALWRGLTRGAAGPVLELGAGAARILDPLLRAGVDAWGVEIDPELRALGLRRLDRLDAADRLMLGDLRAARRDRPYALALATYNVFALFDDADVGEALRGLRRDLTEDGSLLIDAQVWPRHASDLDPSDATAGTELDVAGLPISYRETTRLHPGAGVLHVTQQFLRADAPLERHLELRIRTLAEWDSLLRSQGWRRRGPAVDQAGRPAGEGSRLIFFRAAPVRAR